MKLGKRTDIFTTNIYIHLLFTCPLVFVRIRWLAARANTLGKDIGISLLRIRLIWGHFRRSLLQNAPIDIITNDSAFTSQIKDSDVCVKVLCVGLFCNKFLGYFFLRFYYVKSVLFFYIHSLTLPQGLQLQERQVYLLQALSCNMKHRGRDRFGFKDAMLPGNYVGEVMSLQRMKRITCRGHVIESPFTSGR